MNGTLTSDENQPPDADSHEPDIVASAVAVSAAVYKALKDQDDRPPQRGFKLIMSFLSNGFVLLIVGSIITAFAVPLFERSLSQRTKQLSMMTAAHDAFLQYENSLWREYYSIFPYLHETSLDKTSYIKAIDDIAAIKLDRYKEYATVISLSVAFRLRDDTTTSAKESQSLVEREVEAYAIKVNAVSSKINAILGELYCSNQNCWSSEYTERLTHQHLKMFDDVTKDMQDVVSLGERVAELMVQRIQQEW